MPDPIRRLRNLQENGIFRTGGGMVQMLAGLPEPIQDWVISSIPEDCSLSDLLRAIITDAYWDEHLASNEPQTPKGT